jgi:hypothetical protein
MRGLGIRPKCQLQSGMLKRSRRMQSQVQAGPKIFSRRGGRKSISDRYLQLTGRLSDFRLFYPSRTCGGRIAKGSLQRLTGNVQLVRVLKSINFSYVTAEDRILAAINPGAAEAWSCWLTRRLVLALREAALASTAKSMSTTPPDVLKASKNAAELAEGLKISSQANGFRVELQGEKGVGAAGLLTRAELQRFLQMLQAEVARAGWFGTPEKSSVGTTSEATGAKPVRH